MRKCSTCFYWTKESKRYGKCSKIGRVINLRFHKDEGVIFAMTPRFAVCNEHKTSEEAQSKK